MTEAKEIVRRRGGYFVTGESWSGPWRTEDAARMAMAGDFDTAHKIERQTQSGTNNG